MLLEICVSLTLFLLVLCYLKSTQNYGSFREQGYPEETGYFPFGSQIFWDIYLKRSAIKNYLDDYRQKFPTEKFFIAWDFTQAALFITDPDLGRRILSVDSSYFPPLRKDLKEKQNRYLYSVMPNWTPEESIVKGAEVLLTNWRLRKVSFLLYKTGNDLIDYTDDLSGDMIDVFDLMSRFTMESISRIILGIEGDCLRVKKSLFLNFIRCLSERNEGYPIITGLLDMIGKVLPSAWSKILLPSHQKKYLIQDTFYDIICTSIERISESTQFSLIQLLLWDGSTMPSIDNRLQEQDTYILSYVFLQFLTYFETTTSIHTIATLYLANNPTVQDKLREEICNRREWSIDGLEDMKYLNKVCHEIVELHPELKLIRYNNKIYRLPGTNLDIVEGTQFTFPYDTFLQNIHDERCFPSLDHGKAFAILTLGILLMTLLPLYKIKRNNKTGKELLIQIGRFKGAWVKLERING